MKKMYVLMALACSVLGIAQGTESFENIAGTGPASSYGIQEWTGDNSQAWSATDARRDQILINKAVLIRTGILTGALTTQQASNGIGELTFDYKIPYSDATKDITVEITAGTASYTYNIGTLQQNVIYSSINIPVNAQTAPTLTLTVTSVPSGARLIIDNLAWTAYQTVPDPSFTVSATSISGLNYNEGEGPSTSQSFTLSGEDMDNTDVTLTAPANFEVSLDNTAFTPTVALTSYNGTATTVYVRLASGLAVNTYTGNLSVTGGGAAAATVALDGEVIDVPAPEFTVNVTELEDLTYTENEGPSTPQSFTLTGTDMNGTDVTVTASEHFELSSDNTSFDDTITLTAYNGDETIVYVRLKAALAVDSYTGTVTIAGAGAENLIVNLSGDVTASASVKQDNIDGLSIYPNPARDIITIASNSTAVKNVTISDVTGKKVIETSTAQNVDVANLKAGVYIIHIAQDGKTAVQKLVIK